MIRVAKQAGSGAIYGMVFGAGLMMPGTAGAVILICSSLIAAGSLACMRCTV